MKMRNRDRFLLICNIDYWRKVLDRPFVPQRTESDWIRHERAMWEREQLNARREYDKYVAQLVALELKKHRAAAVRRDRFLAKLDLPKAA